MSEPLPFDASCPITNCPFCGVELENVFPDIEGQPVFVNEEEQSLTPVYITDAGTFMLTEFEDKNLPPYVQHFEPHHMHN